MMNEMKDGSEAGVKDLLLEAVAKVKERGSVSLSDLYVAVGFDDLTLSVYDDDEVLLVQGSVDEWAEFKEDSETFDERVADILQRTLRQREVADAIESLDVIRPFSVLLVDDEFEIKEELMRLDEDNLVLDDEFVKNLDRELDDFLDNLLADC
jgi:hypothetical protein